MAFSCVPPQVWPFDSASVAWPEGVSVTCGHCSQIFKVVDLPYGCCAERLPEEVSARFLRLGRDAACDAFLQDCLGSGMARRFCKDAAAGYLRKRLSLTDANALTGRGTMFVLSTAQARQLLGKSLLECGGILLDVGAGDGAVTAQLAPLFRSVLATEASVPMQRHLSKRGFTVFGGQSLEGLDKAATDAGIELGPGGTVDCIALLNVLDRCSTPRSLLETLRDRLRPGGRLLLAVVLPFRPFVEEGVGRQQPLEPLPLPPDGSWEESVCLLWELMLRPLGFELDALSRLPYLSDGDVSSPVYALDDAVFVLRRPAEGAVGTASGPAS